jgi:hypothetical protein
MVSTFIQLIGASMLPSMAGNGSANRSKGHCPRRSSRLSMAVMNTKKVSFGAGAGI